MADALPMTLRVYRGLSTLASPLTGFLVRRRVAQGKEDPERIGERRGLSNIERPNGPLVWIHGASVGEVLAADALIGRLRALNLRILLTSGTMTSAAIVARRFSADVIHQYIPFDSPRYVTRFLDHWQPSLALFIESDLWPNLILQSTARRVPLVLINGRMSPRSYPRWRRLQSTIGALLGRFDMCLAQSSIDAERFSALGAGDVIATGNLKLDVEAPPVDRDNLERLVGLSRGRPVILAASTHPGEEEIIVAAHQMLTRFFPTLLTVIAPRHPRRGGEIARMVAQSDLRGAMRSANQWPNAQTDIYVADTLGEMGLFYRFAPIVFMGGSLVPHGGQNPIEAIKLGAAIVHGPDVFNFPDVYEALDAGGGATQVQTTEELVKRLGQLLADPATRDHTAETAARTVKSLGGALDRTMAALEPYLLQLRLERRRADA